jgi:hypothetical protein
LGGVWFKLEPPLKFHPALSECFLNR